MNEKKKDKKGISLIVLIITIIIMIILASAVIISLNGSNIIERAHEAVDRFNEGTEIEKIQTILLSSYKNNELTEEGIKEAVDREFRTNKSKVKLFNDGSIIIYIESSKREYYIDNKGNITITNVESVTDTAGLSGEGTEANPYKISSIEDLILLSNNVNNGTTYVGEYIELTRDLNFKGISSYIKYDEIVDAENGIDLITSMITGEGFTPIGNASRKFRGYFNGNGHRISNLYENREDFVSLFYMLTGRIENLSLSDVYLKSTGSDAGGMCMGESADAVNCFIEGTIISDSGQASGYQGAITIERCNIDANIKGNTSAGGLWAFPYGTRLAKNCVIKGNIEGLSAGGLGGYMIHTSNVRIEDCVNYADIIGYQDAGGMIGNTGSSRVIIKNSSNYGKITWTNSGRLNYNQGGGAFFGCSSNLVSLENCVNYGEIISTSLANNKTYKGIGGVLGFGECNCTIMLSLGNISPYYPNNTSYGSIFGVISTGSINAICNYYKKGIAESVVGYINPSSTINLINVEEKEDTYLKLQAFVNELNGLIEAGKTINQDLEDDPETEADEREVIIDTTGYAKWKYNAGSYPTLDLTTKWDGEKWVKE